MAMTFINPLVVPAEREKEFLEKWDRGAEYVRGQPGFITTSLHRSVTDGSRFQYFTVARWESREAFSRATASAWWIQYVRDFGFSDEAGGFQAFPTVCEQVRE